MTQSKYWRFEINNNQNQSSGSSGSSSTSQSGQNQSNQAFLIVEANDEQTAIQQVRQMLQGNQSTQNLGQPTQINEQTARQLTSQTTTV